MKRVFIGSEALTSREITRHDLSRWYRPLFRDVYLDKSVHPTLWDRAEAAYLWSKRRAVITGVAACGLHGADWVRADEPVELIWQSSRPHAGLIVRDERIGADEIVEIDGLPVAAPPRVAFDLGRHLPFGTAVARLDALSRATRFDPLSVTALAERYRGARGLRRLRAALAFVDGGAQSPKESWLRLCFHSAGFPAPITQVPINDDGYIVAYLDLGWPKYKVAVEYDGDHHRRDRRQYARDIRRRQMLEELGWIVVYVVAEEPLVSVLRRVAAALRRRGCAEIDAAQRSSRTFAA